MKYDHNSTVYVVHPESLQPVACRIRDVGTKPFYLIAIAAIEGMKADMLAKAAGLEREAQDLRSLVDGLTGSQ